MKKSVVISALLYYAGWLGAILGAANGYPEAGALIVLAVVIFGVFQGGKPEMGFAALSLLVGACFELSLLEMKLVDYSESVQIPVGIKPPIWMLLLWPLLIRTLAAGQCLVWIRDKTLWCVLFGGFGGGLAYYGGDSLGALEFLSSYLIETAVYIGIGWAIMFPLMAKTRSYMESQLFMSRPKGQKNGDV